MTAGIFNVDRIGHLLHHALVALVLASTFLVLEQFGLLNWLDSITLRLASSLRYDAVVLDEAITDEPIVVGLTRTYWERVLNQRSPIDRHAISDLLNQVAERGPTIIAVDLDLSPGPLEDADTTSQENLDKTLVELGQQGATKVILTAPLAVQTSEALEAKLTWMQKLCRSGVVFSHSTVPTSQNLALRFDPQTASLGLVAAHHSHAIMPGKYTNAERDTLCESALRGLSSVPFLSTTFSPELAFSIDDLKRQMPLDMSRLPKPGTTLFAIASNSELADLPRMEGKIVFVGTLFSHDDEFLTIAGPQAGVMIHAVTYATAFSGHARLSHAAAFSFDVLLGIAVAYLFTWSWSRYRKSAVILGNAGKHFLLRYMHTRGWAIANFLFLSFGLAVIIAYSSVLLHLGVWSNPSAMILGMFVKAFLATRNELSHVTANGPRRPPAFSSRLI